MTMMITVAALFLTLFNLQAFVFVDSQQAKISHAGKKDLIWCNNLKVYKSPSKSKEDLMENIGTMSLASLSHPSEDRNVPSNVPDFSAYKQIPHNPSRARVHSGFGYKPFRSEITLRHDVTHNNHDRSAAADVKKICKSIRRRYQELDVKCRRYKNTRKQTHQAVKLFKEYLKENKLDLDFEKYDVETIDKALTKFYEEIRVKN
ncbi:unnamed protein product [Mytilus coruscus]|uniref:Uncharacterized protein n=1 Tax=Mytilus coruscus TaxID=42192 RepID=A0A6J8CUT9_MYTCO|nr:unnamed protein product [Mytilus coruscus]